MNGLTRDGADIQSVTASVDPQAMAKVHEELGLAAVAVIRDCAEAMPFNAPGAANDDAADWLRCRAQAFERQWLNRTAEDLL